jgi:hypothetical protein
MRMQPDETFVPMVHGAKFRIDVGQPQGWNGKALTSG